MMKKNVIRFFSTMMVALLGMSSLSYANLADPTFTDPSSSSLKNVGNNVLGIIQWVGWGIAIGMLLYIGIKYLMASANEKADLKKGAINYVIGAILIAAASTITYAIGNTFF